MYQLGDRRNSWTEPGQELDFGQQQRRSEDRLPLVDTLFNINPTLKPFGVVDISNLGSTFGCKEKQEWTLNRPNISSCWVLAAALVSLCRSSGGERLPASTLPCTLFQSLLENLFHNWPQFPVPSSLQTGQRCRRGRSGGYQRPRPGDPRGN